MKPYRADVVGSMLRPDYLLKARKEHRAGNLTHEAFKQAEDRAVNECVATQEGCGVDVVTDGEMRRNLFSSQLVQATEGFGRVAGGSVDWYSLDGKLESGPVSIGVVSKLKQKRHLSSEELVYLRARTKRPIKITIPSPTMFIFNWVPTVSEAAYPTREVYLADVTDILRNEVAELVRLDAEYIQIDAPELGMILDPHQQEWFRAKGFEPQRVVHDGTDMINAIIGGYRDVTFALHVCRGNNASRYMAKGSYAAVAKEIFGRTKVDRLLLEYDDERSGDFEPLAEVPENKLVVLGLITTKWARDETPEEVETRIKEATQYIPLERLALSTQCGFASVAQGNSITPEIQEKKLQLVTRVARKIWND
jgi:5-methyltetrahydropteroyltriglutamate--homocysteine methyltransferase